MPNAKRWLGISLGANVLLAIVAAIGWWPASSVPEEVAGTADDAGLESAEPPDEAVSEDELADAKPPDFPGGPGFSGRRPWAGEDDADGGSNRRLAFPRSLTEHCELPEGEELAVTVAMHEDDRPPEVSVLRGAESPSVRACVIARTVEEYARERTTQYATVIIHSDGSTFASRGPEPPLFESHLGVPGVNPVDVANACASRRETGCVRRALDGVELNPRARRTLFWAMASEEDYAALRDAMSSLDDDDAAAPSLSPFQALLWRLEHGLPPGPAPDFHRMRPIFDR